MAYFKSSFVNFFKELSKNNSTQWFDVNRKTYESEVKKPFALFVDELIAKVAKFDPAVKIKASEAITRINKDIRFSKEKIPYNTYVGAIISPFGRKSKEYPGLYIQLGADKILIYGGAYALEKDSLLKTRQYICAHLKEFDTLINQKEFKAKFGSILGEKNKVLAPEFKKLLEKQPLLANKSFHFMTELNAKHILSSDLTELMAQYYKIAKPVNDFLIKAMKK